MLTWEDCLALSCFSEDVIDAIAEHEHVPEMVALELAEYLVHADDGIPRLKRMILDDIAAADARGDVEHARRLRLALHHFVASARAMQAVTAASGKAARQP
jgi:hypothetical protein